MYPRHRLDIGFRDVVVGLAARPHWPAIPSAGRPTCCGRPALTDQGLVCLSVRSAWDLVLEALDWPPGSEVIVSAITHPDMITIIRAHGLVAVPVDVDLNTLAPAVADLERARIAADPGGAGGAPASAAGSTWDRSPTSPLATACC